MQKLLYVDVPFAEEKGGDKNRSKFLWSVLSKSHDSDLLLIRTVEYITKPIPTHEGYDKFYTIGVSSHPFWQSKGIYHFSKKQKDKFVEILEQRRYEVVVFRFIAPAELANIIQQVLPNCKVVIDVDMLLSRIADLTWEQHRSWEYRYYWQEKIKLSLQEKQLFRQPYQFLFTNGYEVQLAVEKYGLQANKERYVVLPNVMQFQPLQTIAKKKYLLFFGTLNSAANSDAFLYLAREIYPRIAKLLAEYDMEILVAGKNPLPIHEEYSGGRIRVVGPVENLTQVIREAAMIILPLRVASGTRTRILEAAALQQSVITTTIGTEGFEFGESEIALADDAESFADKIADWVKYPEKAESFGKRLLEKARQLYSEETVANQLNSIIGEKEAGIENKAAPIIKGVNRLRIAIVTNRFYPEVGGAETNIYYQAKEMAKQYEVTIFCPHRIDRPSREEMDGFHVCRMTDMFNLPPQYPNIRSKTFCPSLFTKLVSGKFDIIQCFPAINYNNMLAVIAAKLTHTPIILCCFDFLDYATIIKQQGRINPNLLASYQPSFKEVFFIKRFDFIFAIANKEIEFFKQYTPNVDYSPVPIALNEYEQEAVSPKERYQINADEFVFLSLGRVSNVKGQDIALSAFSKVHDQLPKSKLVFVGRADYEPEFYQSMQDLIQEKGISDKVIFTGMVEREEVLGWLHYSDIHVIPVRFMNSGAVVVESWISGTPVIQSDVVDPNLVVEGENGYLFPRENVDALAEKMVQAYNEREKFRGFAANGMALVKAKYTYEYLISLYAKTYLQLLQ